MTTSNPIFFKIYNRSAPDLLSGKPYFIFKDFKNSLTDDKLTVGVDRMIYTAQDDNGNITLPKGIYEIKLQCDFKFLNVIPESDFPGKVSSYNPGLKFFVNDKEINDCCEFKILTKDNTLPLISYSFGIFEDTGKFRIETWGKVYVENKEQITYRYSLKNIVIIIQKIADLPAK